MYINLELKETYKVLYRNELLYENGLNINMYLGFYDNINNSNDVIYIQDFRIFPSYQSQSQLNELKELTSNVLYYGNNCDLISNIKEIIIQPIRWIESSSYASNYFNPFSRYITYNGNNGLGIGKSSIPEATLDIYTDDPTMYSIKTNNPIWVKSTVVSSSDSRIKTNVRNISGESALRQMLTIEPKIYDYIDINRSKKHVYGFSAQQIKHVIPNAVSLHTEAIPNIYSKAKLTNNHIVQLINHKHNIKNMSIVCYTL